MPMIIPINKLRNTTEISELCHKLNEPIFITKNGYGDLVIMSVEAYEKRIFLSDVYNKLAEAKTQLNKGELVDAEEVLENLRRKSGLVCDEGVEA
jgi:PHD/YefM family antitoxin component YafN of YafNO toxin-antitoxin module